MILFERDSIFPNIQYMLLVFNKISVFSLLTITKACYVCFLEGVTVRKESNDVNDELALVFLFFFKLCGIILSVHDVGSQARKQNEKLSQMVIKTLLDIASKFIFGYRIPKEDKILRFKL